MFLCVENVFTVDNTLKEVIMGIQLRNNEEIVREARPHWSSYILPAILAAIGVNSLVTVIYMSHTPEGARVAGTLAALKLFAFVWVAPLIWKIISNYFKIYIITNHRVYVEQGVISKLKLDVPFNKINDIQMSQGLVQRIFGSGNIRIFTGNSLPVIMEDLDIPNEFKEEIFGVISS